MSLALSVLLVFGAAKLMGELFERLRQPGIIGEILAGVLIGPSALGWIAPTDTLRFLAELGVMFLLFRVGLEITPPELMKVGRSALLVALLGVGFSIAGGYVVMRLWGRSSIEALFVGASIAATSVGITAQVLASRGLLTQTASRVILAAAVIDDVLALLVLGIISSLATGKVNMIELTLTTTFAVAFIFVIARWGNKAIARIAPQIRGKFRTPDGDFAIAIIFLFGLAALSERAGVAPIIGAFLAGMALGDALPQRAHALTHGATELLLPFFFAGIGLSFNLNAFATGSTLLLAFLVLCLAVLAKILAGFLGALNYGRRAALRVGLGMIPRGEFTVVVAQVGLGLKVVSPASFGIVVFVAVCATLLTPPLLRLAFKAEATG